MKTKRDEREKATLPARKAYHEAVADAWKVYGRATDAARAALHTQAEPTEEDWQIFNVETLAARKVFETSIYPTWKARAIAMKE